MKPNTTTLLTLGGFVTALALAIGLSSCGEKKAGKSEASAGGSAAAPAAPAKTALPPGEIEDLKVDYPKPMFVGTPTNIRSPNLEKVTGKSRGPFYVPTGTVLLSLKKKVTSSDNAPVIGDLDMITDGEKSGGDGFFVELGPMPQWVQVDLGVSRPLYAIRLGADTRDAADQLCARLRAAGGACMVVKN